MLLLVWYLDSFIFPSWESKRAWVSSSRFFFGNTHWPSFPAPGHAFADADPYVGRGPYDQFWVKAKLVTPEGQEPQYLLCKVMFFVQIEQVSIIANRSIASRMNTK